MPENVEIVRRQFELWNDGDLDAALRHYHPDVTVIAPEGWPDGPRTEGAEAWRLQAERLRDTWKSARIEIEALQPIGDEGVVAEFRYLTEGESGGIAFDTPMGVHYRLRDEVIVHAEYFWSFDDALAAAEHPE